MYKIYKTAITGFDIPGYPQGVIGINSNYRTTMGYNDSTKTISVSVDKLVRPDLNSDEAAPITYQNVATRSFTPADFVQQTDNMAWVVEFDVTTEKILDPFNVLSYTATKIDSSNTHQDIWKMIKERHGDELFPCFQVESFYKSVTDFSASVLTFHTVEGGSQHDTVIESTTTPTPVELTTQARVQDIQNNYVTNILFQILNADGTVNTTEIPESEFGVFASSGADPKKVCGNQFKINLPASPEYKIRVIYSSGYSNKQTSATYDVRCINGLPSKTRLISGTRSGQSTPDFSYLGPNVLATKFAGYEDVIIDNKLTAGDFIKFKLDCGPQITFAELMINLV